MVSGQAVALQQSKTAFRTIRESSGLFLCLLWTFVNIEEALHQSNISDFFTSCHDWGIKRTLQTYTTHTTIAQCVIVAVDA